MNGFAIAGLVLLGLIVAGSVFAWGMVQVLDVMEALDLRRIEKQKELQKAREYLRNPQGQDQTGQTTTYPYYSQTTTTSPNPSGSGMWSSGTSGNVNSTQLVNLNNWVR